MKLRLWAPDGPKVDIARKGPSRTFTFKWEDLIPLNNKRFMHFAWLWVDDAILPIEEDDQ